MCTKGVQKVPIVLRKNSRKYTFGQNNPFVPINIDLYNITCLYQKKVTIGTK